MSGSQQYGIYQSQNQVAPLNCITKTIGYVAQTASGTNATADLTQLFQQGKIDQIQTIFVDNYNNTEPFIVTCGVTNQRIVVPAGSQGYFPTLTPNPPSFSFYTTGGVNVPVYFLNQAMPLAVWPNGSGGSSVPSFTGLVDVYNIQVGSGGSLANGEYYFQKYAPWNATLNEVICLATTSGGSYQAAIHQNGTAIAGMSGTITSSDVILSPSSATTINIGDTLTLVITSATTGITEAMFAMKVTHL